MPGPLKQQGVIYRENSRKVNERFSLCAVKFQPSCHRRQLSR